MSKRFKSPDILPESPGMEHDLVDVYQASTMTEAQMLKDRLASQDIEAFLDNTDSPFDGLTAANQYIVVRVLPDDAPLAREVAAAFAAE